MSAAGYPVRTRESSCGSNFLSSDEVEFATADYAGGFRTSEMFRKIDADGDGSISKDEVLSYHRKVFEMLDTTKKGMVGPTDWIRKSG